MRRLTIQWPFFRTKYDRSGCKAYPCVPTVVKARGMDDKLLGIVLERLEKSPLAEDATDLLLAAFESEESLSGQLSGEAAALSADVAGVARPEPAGAYL